MSDEEELLNNAAVTAESPISKAMAAHLDSLMEGDEADDFDLPEHIAFDLGPEADVEAEDTQMYEKETNDQAEVETTAPVFQPIDIPISFSTKGGGAWDDRELVSAFDAAKEEFHLHNPGPGSWLDKTTAALAMGKPLVGAQYGESNLIMTRWYASYDPAEDPALPSHHLAASTSTSANGNAQKEGSKSKAAKKRKRNAEAANANRPGLSNGFSNQGKKVRIDAPNPYIDTNPFIRSTPGSPAFSPASPPYYTTSPPAPTYGPVSPTYTPGSPTFAPGSPAYTPGSPGFTSEGQAKRADPTRSVQGVERVMMGPDIPDQQRGRRLPNYAALASPSPPRSKQPSIATHNGSRPSGPNLNPAQQRGRQDPTYEASTSGVYPSMGLSGFTSTTEMNREVAMSRAVNAQWWAGYWFAMSEVLPPAEE